MQEKPVRRLLRNVLATTLFLAIAIAVPFAAAADCGDGVIDFRVEQCDDGNTDDGDCCNTNCTLEQAGSPCLDDGNQCTFDACDGEGTCRHDPGQGECDDGNDCTVGDFCSGTVCVSEGIQEDFSSCFDQGLCGSVGQCSGGYCVGDPVDCAGYQDVCHSAICNPQLGRCEVETFGDGTACDNPSTCTDPGQCQQGECTQPPTDCSDLADACNDAFCDVEAGGCYSIAKNSGTPCDDTNGCTDPGQCDDGECLTTPKDCASYADGCNDAACDAKTEEGCYAVPKTDGTRCDDDIVCTDSEQCVAGLCQGSATDCSSFDDQCHVGICNDEIGGCQADLLPNGTSCNDGNACTVGDQCTDGTCGSSPTDCSNFHGECTTAVCNPTTGACEAIPSANGTPCSDNAFCTATDACQDGVCQGNGDPCSGQPVCAAACNEATDSCNAANGAPCETDGNPCTDDVCNGEGSCQNVANEAACDDALYCTENDRCEDSECIGDPLCPPTDSCSDTCDEEAQACRTCGHPFSNSRCVVNAVFVLQGALELRVCELCTCDVDNNGTVSATDALKILRTCADLPTALTCPTPAPDTSTTTTLPSM